MERNKQLDSTPCMILQIIFKIDKGGTQTNRPEEKEIDDNAHGLTPKRWQTMCQEKKKEEDSPDLRIA